MVKQKMVIKLPLGGKKTGQKALKTAAGMEGVISVELDDDNRLVLVGEGTDVIKLTKLLRKKLGYADVISVTIVEEINEEEENSTNSTSPQRDCYYYPNYPYGVPTGGGYIYPCFYPW